MLPPTASPNRIARSTAPRFATGSTPGRAMSTALVWVFGAAPKAVGAPENIFDCVESWAWVSRPMTVSHSIAAASGLRRVRHPQMPVGRTLECMRHVQHPRLGKVVADDLEPHRQAATAEPARDRHRRQPREVPP